MAGALNCYRVEEVAEKTEFSLSPKSNIRMKTKRCKKDIRTPQITGM